MTEAFQKWCLDNGINNPADTWMRLRAFVQEVSNRADKCTFSEHLTKEGCAPIMNCLQLAYDGLVREFGLDSDKERP